MDKCAALSGIASVAGRLAKPCRDDSTCMRLQLHLRHTTRERLVHVVMRVDQAGYDHAVS